MIEKSPQKVNYIDLDLMEKMCHPLAVAIFDKQDDPIANFHDAMLAKLDAALNNPRQTFDGKDLYPTFTKKAAILYYGLNKAHAFENGNKRMATASLLVFLHINDYSLKGDQKEIEDYLVDLALRVASSKGSADKELFLGELETWLENHFSRN